MVGPEKNRPISGDYSRLGCVTRGGLLGYFAGYTIDFHHRTRAGIPNTSDAWRYIVLNDAMRADDGTFDARQKTIVRIGRSA
jgi:hypothetical protein